jgi:hypothetical protein
VNLIFFAIFLRYVPVNLLVYVDSGKSWVGCFSFSVCVFLFWNHSTVCRPIVLAITNPYFFCQFIIPDQCSFILSVGVRISLTDDVPVISPLNTELNFYSSNLFPCSNKQKHPQEFFVTPVQSQFWIGTAPETSCLTTQHWRPAHLLAMEAVCVCTYVWIRQRHRNRGMCGAGATAAAGLVHLFPGFDRGQCGAVAPPPNSATAFQVKATISSRSMMAALNYVIHMRI